MKKSHKKAAQSVVFMACMGCFFISFSIPSVAWAYIEPGTGSVLLQILIGGFAGIAVAFKLLKNKLRRFISRDKEKENGT